MLTGYSPEKTDSAQMNKKKIKRKDTRTDAEIEADVDRMIAERHAADKARMAAYERSSFRFFIWMPLCCYSASLVLQIAVPLFWEKIFVLAIVVHVLSDLHMLSLVFLVIAVYNAGRAKNRPKVVAFSLVLTYGVLSVFFLAEPLEDKFRDFLFSDAASVEARITSAGYKGQGVGQRVKFEYEFNGKRYDNYEDFNNGYFFANEKKFKQGKFLHLRVSKKIPYLYQLEMR